MRVSIVHGADRCEAGSGTESRRPFHGIASRGLLGVIGERPDLASEWCKVAPQLDSASDFWIDAAARCKMLSYVQSADCAKRFLACHGKRALALAAPAVRGDVDAWELWSVKEGHTASIWCVTAFLAGGDPVRFCLNVARDAAASDELDVTARMLQTLARRHPDAVARVLMTEHVQVEPGRPDWVIAVVATTWVEGWELHALCGTNGSGRLVAVDRFLCSETDPAVITRIAGFDPGDGTWERLLLRWIRLGDWSRVEGPVRLPVFEINHGDWMLTEGDVVLCALSAAELELDPAVAIWRCILFHARNVATGDRLHWGDSARAIAVLEAARSPERPALSAGLALSQTTPIEELRRAGLVIDPTGEALWDEARRCLSELESEG